MKDRCPRCGLKFIRHEGFSLGSTTINMVSFNDLCDRPPRQLADGEVLDLGTHRLRHIDTPHVPHGWEARVLYDETTKTLLAGDLFSNLGDPAPLTTDAIVGAASQAEDMRGPRGASTRSTARGRARRTPSSSSGSSTSCSSTSRGG